MAGIDKTYTDSYTDYVALKNWARGRFFTCPNGQKLYPYDYIYDWFGAASFNNGPVPVMNTSREIDYFLIKECPLEFVQNQMKLVYSNEYYDSIKNGTSEWDKFTKEGKVSTHFKIVKYPWYGKCNRWVRMWHTITHTLYYPCVWIECSHPEIDLNYDEESNKWIWQYELGHWNSNVCHRKIKTIKAVMRHIRNWQLPKGTVVKVSGRYVGETWEILCK